MQVAAVPPDERDRLGALRALGILDTPPEESFDRLARLAAALTGAPIALVSFVDADRQWSKAEVGIQVGETPRDVAFCAHAILVDGDRPFVVNDAAADRRFVDNPLVTGDPGIRFYAGQPLRAPGGERVGTLCIMDRQPRQLTGAHELVLADLTGLAEDLLSRRILVDAVDRLEESERQKALLLDTIHDGLVFQDASGRVVEWNPAAEQILGLSGPELRGAVAVDGRWRALREDGEPFAPEAHPSMVSLRTGMAVLDELMGCPGPTVRWPGCGSARSRPSTSGR